MPANCEFILTLSFIYETIFARDAYFSFAKYRHSRVLSLYLHEYTYEYTPKRLDLITDTTHVCTNLSMKNA